MSFFYLETQGLDLETQGLIARSRVQTTPSEFVYIKNWKPITPNTMPLGGKKSGTVLGGTRYSGWPVLEGFYST